MVAYEVLHKHKHVSYGHSNLVLIWMKKPEIEINDTVYRKISSYVCLLAATNWFMQQKIWFSKLEWWYLGTWMYMNVIFA